MAWLAVAGAALRLASAAGDHPQAGAQGITYVERRSTTFASVGPPLSFMEPSAAVTELVQFDGRRGRRQIMEGHYAEFYSRDDFELFDTRGAIVVHPTSRTFSLVTELVGTESALLGRVGPPVMSESGAQDGGVRSLMSASALAGDNPHVGVADLSIALDPLGAGGLVDGRATQHYRLNETLTLQAPGPDDCAPGAIRRLKSTELAGVARITSDYWLASPEGMPAAAGILAPGQPNRDIGDPMRESLALLRNMAELADQVVNIDMTPAMLAKLEAAESGLPRDQIALRMVRTVEVRLGMTGREATRIDTAEVTALNGAAVDSAQLALPEGYAQEARPQILTHPDTSHSWDAAAYWRGLSDRPLPPSPRGVAGGRSFAISPPLNGATTWSLDADGSLGIGDSGTWVITPTVTFDARVKMWGAGGGSGFRGRGFGGGGGYSEGVVTFRAGVTYTVIVGGGGKGARVAACGGAGGFGGGGAGGGLHSAAEGAPGVPFGAGGPGHAGDGVEYGAAGGGGGLSGLFVGASPSQSSALLIAAGGGGGAYSATDGGAGGGERGDPGEWLARGLGGSQTAPGAAGSGGLLGMLQGPPGTSGGCLPPAGAYTAARKNSAGASTPGAAGVGGGGGYANGCGAGGGGGSGYFGGGGGGQNRGGGGGGSGFVASGASGGHTTKGNGNRPGNLTDPLNGGAGFGAITSGYEGAPGRVIILQ